MLDKENLMIQIRKNRFTDPQKVITLSEKLLESAKKEKNKKEIIFARFFIGDASLTLGNIEKAVEVLADVLSLQTKWEIEDYMEHTYNDLAICFDLQGDYLLSLEYYTQGINLAIKNKNYKMQGALYDNTGCIFLKYGDDKNALKYFEKAGKARKSAKTNNSADEIFYHMRMAQVYAHEKKLDDLKREYHLAIASSTNEGIRDVSVLLKYLEMTIAYLEKDTNAFDQTAQDLIQLGKEKPSIEDWDEWVAMLEMLKKSGDHARTEAVFEIIKNMSDNASVSGKKSMLFRKWVQYLGEIGEEEKRKEYLRLFYDMEHQIKENRRNSQIQQINNRLLLNQKIEERSIMRQKRQALSESSKKDPMTELLSRFTMIDFLEKMLKRGAVEKRVLNCGLIEIRDFETINETYGHVVGDMCLKYVAEAIKKNETEEMLSAHMRGKEFMILSFDLTMQEFEAIVSHIEMSLRKPLFFNGLTVPIHIKYGLASKIPELEDTVYDVFRQTNEAMYSLEESGKNELC